MALSEMQKRYIWLAGSFPHLAVKQGRGCRKEKRLMYAINDASEELVLFGYQNPLLFLEGRGFFRRQQSGAFTLTDLGDAAFREMLARGAGAELNEQVVQVRLRRA